MKLTPKQMMELERQMRQAQKEEGKQPMTREEMFEALGVKVAEKVQHKSYIDEVIEQYGIPAANELFERAKAIVESQREEYERKVAMGEIEPFDRSKYYEDNDDMVIPKSNYNEETGMLYDEDDEY